MKKYMVFILVLAVTMLTMVFPVSVGAAVTVDASVNPQWGFSSYAGSGGYTVNASVADSGESGHGAVLKYVASGNVDRSNRYGGLYYNITLQPGTYRAEISAKDISYDLTSNPSANNVVKYLCFSSTFHGDVWTSPVTGRKDMSVGTGSWYTLYRETTITSATTLKVQIGMDGNGEVWFDNLLVYNKADSLKTNLLPTGSFTPYTLDPPANVRISGQSVGTQTLSWDAVSGAQGYLVTKACGNAVMEVYNGTQTQTVVEVTSGTQTYSVSAYGDGVLYGGSDPAGISFDEITSFAGLPEEYGQYLANATGNHVVTVSVSDTAAYDGQKSLKIVQSSARASNTFAGIVQYLPSDKLVVGQTYKFGGYIKKEVTEGSAGKIYMRLGNSLSYAKDVVSGTSAADWTWWSQEIQCTSVSNFGFNINVDGNFTAYLDGLICYDTKDPSRQNLILNGDFESASGEAKNITVSPGLNRVSVRWDYPNNKRYSGAELYKLDNLSAPVASVTKTAGASNLAVIDGYSAGELARLKLVLVDLHGVRSEGVSVFCKTLVSESSVNTSITPDIPGWAAMAIGSVAESTPGEIRIDSGDGVYSDADPNGAFHLYRTTANAANTYYMLKQTVTGLEAGASYTLSYKYKNVKDPDGNQWRAVLYFPTAFDGNSCQGLGNAQNTWASMDFAKTITGTEAVVQFIISGKYEFWLDGLTLYKTDDATKTNLLVNPSLSKAGVISGIQNASIERDGNGLKKLLLSYPADTTYLKTEFSDKNNKVVAVAHSNVDSLYSSDLSGLDRVQLVSYDSFARKSVAAAVQLLSVAFDPITFYDSHLEAGKQTSAIVTVSNDSVEEFKADVVIALYQNGVLVSTGLQVLECGKSDYPQMFSYDLPEIPANATGYSAKVFVWDMNTMIPYVPFGGITQ